MNIHKLLNYKRASFRQKTLIGFLVLFITGYSYSQYCTPYSTVSPITYGIKNFSTSGCIQNISNLGSVQQAYSDHTNMTVIQSLGGTVNFSVDFYTPSSNPPPTSERSSFIAWVDWNQDGVFASNEIVYGPTAFAFSGHGFSASFQVPNTATIGTTRMRIYANANTAMYSDDPCTGRRDHQNDYVFNGEFEDYTFEVKGPCVPHATNSSRYIQNFTTSHGIQNIENLNSGFSSGGYGNFTHKIVEHEQGKTVDFKAEFPQIPGYNGYGFRIWVDWNDNGIFDGSEVVYSSPAYLWTQIGSITVPATATPGPKRMRIVNHWNNASGNTTPCNQSFADGEFEDYTFLVREKCGHTISAGNNASICKGGETQLGAYVKGPRISLFKANFNENDGGFTGTTQSNRSWVYASPPQTGGAGSGESINPGSKFWIFVSRGETPANTNTSTLKSPKISTSGYEDVQLTMKHYFRQHISPDDIDGNGNPVDPSGNSAIYVEFSKDGTNWKSIDITHDHRTNYRIGKPNEFATYKTTLPEEFYNQSTLYVRFSYKHSSDWSWSIDDVELTGVTTGYYSYNWTGGSILEGGTTLIPTVNPEETQVYQAQVSVAGCVKKSDNTTVYVNALDPGEINSQNICEESTVSSLQGQLPTGDLSSNYTYQWEISPNCDGQWQDISGATGANYNPGTITEDLCVRRRVSSKCATAYSTPIFLKNNLVLHYSFDEPMEPTKNLIAGSGFSQIDPSFESYENGEEIAILTNVSSGERASVYRQLADDGHPIAQVSTERSYHGSKSLKINRKDGTNYGANNNGYNSTGFSRFLLSDFKNGLPIGSGKSITFSVWVYSTSPGPHLRIEYKGGNYNWQGYVSTYHTGNGWEKLTVTYPTTTSSTGGYFFLVSPNKNSATYWDDLQIEEKAYATEFANEKRDPATIIDHSNNGHNGRLLLENHPKWVANGVEAGAYAFDGSGGRIESLLATEMNQYNSNITISGWTKPSQSVSYFMGYQSAYFGTLSYAPIFRAYIGGTLRSVSSPHLVTQNDWYFYTATYDGSKMRLYVNGELKNELSVSGTIANNGYDLIIGGTHIQGGSTNAPLTGQVDDIRVYDKAMTEQEVEDLFYSYSRAVKVDEKPVAANILIDYNDIEYNCYGRKVNLEAINGYAPGESEFVWSSNHAITVDNNNPLLAEDTPEVTTTYTITTTANGACPAAAESITYSMYPKGNQLALNGQSRTCYVSGDDPIYFYDKSSGRYLGAVNPKNKVGKVTMTAYVKSDAGVMEACGHQGNPYMETAYLERSFLLNENLDQGNSNNYEVHFPFYNTEFSRLVTKSSNTLNPNDDVSAVGDLYATKYSGPNENDTPNDNCNSGTSSLLTKFDSGTMSTPAISNTSFASFKTPSFSEFWLHGAGNPGSPLPIELISFTASCQDDGTHIIWSTASETNSDYFSIEYSRNGSDWTSVATIDGAGNSSVQNDYLWIDYSNNTGYYRLIQVDYNGEQTLFGPISSNCTNGENYLTVYPNPALNDFTVEINASQLLGESTIVVYEISGRAVLSKELIVYSGVNKAQFDAGHLAPGTYIVGLKDADSTKFVPVKLIVR